MINIFRKRKEKELRLIFRGKNKKSWMTRLVSEKELNKLLKMSDVGYAGYIMIPFIWNANNEAEEI